MLVDYNIASLMLPMIVVGATIGVMVNKILPMIVVTITLTLLLLFVSYTTLRKFMKIRADELKKFGPFCGKKIEQEEAEVP